jgi:hypothetical protein
VSKQDPDALEEVERERDRERHRAQLEAVRAAFAPEPEGGAPETAEPGDDGYDDEYLDARLVATMRALEQRQRRTVWFVGIAVTGLVAAGAALLAGGIPTSEARDEIYARSIRADRVAVTGDLRLLDETGRELAVLGREGGIDGARPDAPVVLSMHAEGDPGRQILRLAASKTGAALSLDSPTGESSLSLLSMASGPTLELRSGEKSRRLSSEPSAAAPAAEAAPAVAAGTRSAGVDVPAWTPRREALPTGAIPEVRDIGHGFLIADLEAAPAPEGGLEIRGRVVNTTSVVHAGLAFRVRAGDVAETFTISRISPGNSTGFAIAMPGAFTEAAADVRVEYLGSTVGYQASSTEPLYGRRVEVR